MRGFRELDGFQVCLEDRSSQLACGSGPPPSSIVFESPEGQILVPAELLEQMDLEHEKFAAGVLAAHEDEANNWEFADD